MEKDWSEGNALAEEANTSILVSVLQGAEYLSNPGSHRGNSTLSEPTL
jgi:hypothetical protein